MFRSGGYYRYWHRPGHWLPCASNTYRAIADTHRALVTVALGLHIAIVAILFSQVTGHGTGQVLFSGQSELPGLILGIGIGAMCVSMLQLTFTSVLLATVLLTSDGYAAISVAIVAVLVAHVRTAWLPPPNEKLFTWALPMRAAVARAGGAPLQDQWIQPLDLVEVGLMAAKELELT